MWVRSSSDIGPGRSTCSVSETEIPSCYCRDEVFEEKSCLYEPHTEYFAGLTSPAHRSGLCMWWDERCPSNPDDTLAEQEATHLSCTRLLQAFVDLDCPYVRSLVLEAFLQHPQWQAVPSATSQNQSCNHVDEQYAPSADAVAAQLVWAEYECIDWERIYAGEQWASSYCVRKGLIRKAHLAHNLKKWAAKHPDGLLAGSVPETHIMEVDDVEYIDEALADVYEVRDMVDGSATWIAKPSITNQAIGICIFDRVSNLRSALEAAEDMREWVVQRYIERPLLVTGRKFHIRAYVLCVGSLSVYAFSEALALFAGEPYTGAPLEDLSAHLTNTCRLNRQDAEAGSRGGDTGAEEGQTVVLMSELPQALHEQGMALAEAHERVQQLTHNMQRILGECMEAVSSELSFFTLPNCFELFGFDLLVDEDWHLWLLEANAEPDLAQTGERLRPVMAALIQGILNLVLPSVLAGDPTRQGQHTRAVADYDGKLEGRFVKIFERQQGGRGGGGPRLQLH